MSIRDYLRDFREAISHNDEYKIGRNVFLFLLVAFVAIDFLFAQLASGDFWKNILVEAHGTLFDVAATALVIGLWMHLRERRQWRPTKQLIHARALVACNWVAGSIARPQGRFVYDFGAIPVQSSFDFEVLGGLVDGTYKPDADEDFPLLLWQLGNLAAGRPRPDAQQGKFEVVAAERALAELDSVMDIGAALVNRGVDPDFLSEVAALRQSLSDLIYARRRADVGTNAEEQEWYRVRNRVLPLCLTTGRTIARHGVKRSSAS